MKTEHAMRVTLKDITPKNLGECLALDVAESQQGMVAPNATSLAEAYVHRYTVHPFAVYEAVDANPRMVGFTMYEVSEAVGFITRIMIDERYQRRGYGAAAVRVVIRKLRSNPDVNAISTSHLRSNKLAARFFESLGFREWSPDWAAGMPEEQVLLFDDD